MTKTILFVAHSGSLAGGGEKSLLDSVLEAQRTNKYSVKVVVPEGGDFSAELQKHGVYYTICPQRFSIKQPSSEKPSFWEAVANADTLSIAKKIITEIKPDVIVINTSVIPWFGYIAKIFNIPVITVIRELHGGKNEFDFLPNDSAYLNALSSYSTTIAYNSLHTQSSYKNLLPDNKGFILYPVVTIPNETLEIAKSKSIFADPQAPTSIIILGNIAPHKNQFEVVKAIHLLISKYKKTDVRLSIMGPIFKDAYANKLKKYISDNSLEEYVKFIPFSKNPYPHLLKHDILVMASPHEAFGRVSIESQLLERLTIGAGAAGTLEIIEDEKSGLLYQPGSPDDLAKKILWSIDNPEKAKTIAQHGKKSATKKYSAKHIYRPFFSHIDDLLMHKKNTPEIGQLYYDPLYALIERNTYIDSKLQEYAESLENAIHELEVKQSIIDRGLRARAKRVVKKAIRK